MNKNLGLMLASLSALSFDLGKTYKKQNFSFKPFLNEITINKHFVRGGVHCVKK